MQMREGAWTWASVLFAVPGFVLITPIFYLVYVMMTLHMAGPLLTLGALALSLIFPMVCTPRDNGDRFLVPVVMNDRRRGAGEWRGDREWDKEPVPLSHPCPKGGMLT